MRPATDAGTVLKSDELLEEI